MERVVPPIHGPDHAIGGPDPIESFALWPIKVASDIETVSTLTPFTYLVPQDLDAHTLVRLEAFVSTAGGSDLEIQISKAGGADLLTTLLTIDAGDLDSKTSGTTPVIDAAEAEVLWGDHLVISVISDGGGATGLGVYCYFLASPDALAAIAGPQGDTGATGATGPQGDPGDTGPQGDPGGIVAWTGEWDVGTTYSADDAVSHDGSSYVAIAGSTAVEPGVTGGWETSWMLLSGGFTLPLAADDVSITDTGAFFTATDVEGALQELGAGSGGSFDPIADIFGAPATAFEFDTSSFTGLTATSPTPDVENADTSIPGHYFVADNAAATSICGRYFNPGSAPWTAIAYLADASTLRDFSIAGLFMGVATPGQIEVIAHGIGARDILHQVYTNPTTFSSTVSVAYTTLRPAPYYFAIRANSSTSFDLMFSFTGKIWTPVASARNPGITIASVGVFLSASNTTRVAVAFDFLRLWTSALTFPGVV